MAGIDLLIFSGIGVVAGVLAGLLEISSGVVTIPLLVLAFNFLGIPSELIMHMAIGTSLAAMIFNTLSSSLSHHKKGNVILKISKSLIPSCIIGAIIGAYVAKMLSGYFLQIFFGVFECVIGVYFFATAKKMIAEDAPLPKYLVLFIIGLIVSSFSTLVGIGGGVLLVPILSFCNVPIKKAIGTSSSVSLIITFIGAISYLLLGLNVSSVPDGVGFLYLPAFITISIAAFIAAPFGVKLTGVLPAAPLKRIFAVALVGAGIAMLFG